MYRVLIADDEPSIRNGLARLIDWDSLGFEITALASDGKEALKQIEKDKPDLLLIDIKMPNMDGLELMDTLKFRNIACKIIVISAYSEFKYAKKAIEVGAKTYLLKPISPEDLTAAVVSVKEDLMFQENLSRNLNLNRFSSLYTIGVGLLTGNENFDSLVELGHKFSLHLPWTSYRIIGSVPNNSVREILRGFCSRYPESIPFRYNAIDLILCDNRYFAEDDPSLLPSLAREIKQAISETHLLAASRVIRSKEELHIGLLELEEILKNSFLFQNKTMIDLEKLTKPIPELPAVTEESLKELYTYIQTSNLIKITGYLEELKNCCMESMSGEKLIKNLYCDLMAKINKKFDFIENLNSLFYKIYNCSSIENLHDFVKVKIMELSDKLLETGNLQNLDEIISFINRNFKDTELALNQLSTKFGYHPTYLGVLLKNKVGKSFNQYLLDLRLNHACTLLRQGVSITDTAYECGFSDAEYFRKLFKKTYHISPAKWKQTL